jgi:3-hydroxybutyryl-CoA dehydrogenase
MEIKTVGVVGAGQMGSGIAQVAAQAGFSVILNDILEDYLKKALDGIRKSLSKFVEKGKISKEQEEEIRSRIKTDISLSSMADADFVVEAIVENERIKTDIFQKLDQIVKPEGIIASNTSSISITRLAGSTKRPEKVIGMHFMNPVPLMKLVEIIRALQTSEETFQITKELALKMDKVPVEAKDYPGFISNRILMPMINEAVYALFEGVGSAEEIDQVMKLGMNHPMGPLALADLIGLDTCLAIMEVLHRGLGDDKYRPCPLLRKYVEAGWLGRKTKRGFYQY